VDFGEAALIKKDWVALEYNINGRSVTSVCDCMFIILCFTLVYKILQHILNVCVYNCVYVYDDIDRARLSS